MKIKNVFEFFHLRKSPRHYPYEMEQFELDNGETVHFAKWLKKYGKKRKVITSDQVEQYREHISPGDFCIDIGAHVGDSTMPMAIAAGTTGLCLAFEPNPYIYHVLEKNIRSNRHLCHIESMMAAASDREGFVTFNYSDSAHGNGGEHPNISKLKHGHMYEQEVFSVDVTQELKDHYSEWLPKLRFIKVDAEGSDLYILKALEEIIREYQPALKCEVFKHTSVEYRRELVEYLNSLGYTAWKIVKEPISPGKQLSPESMTDWLKFDLLAVA